jgi:UDP-N-acetyl-2-amino-2-deoxyglucuronate dehydrogenase
MDRKTRRGLSELKTKSMQQPHAIGIVLVGCGRISTHHLDAIQARPDIARLVAVVDRDLPRAREIGARYGARFVFGDLPQALALREVEAVCLCTPNALHKEQTLAALNAGRHVLVEKPMAESAADAAEMAVAAGRTGLILAAAHTFRHTLPIRYLQDHRGEYGRLRAAQVSWCVRWNGPQAPWWKTRTPRDGLVLSLLAPHCLDFLVHIMGGDDPVRVSVETARHQQEWQAEDEAMILLRYPGDRMAFVHVSYNQPWITNRKSLHFEKATVVIEHDDYLSIDGESIIEPPDIATRADHKMGGRDDSFYFQTQIEEFVRAIRGQTHRSVLHHEGCRVVALIERILAAVPPS